MFIIKLNNCIRVIIALITVSITIFCFSGEIYGAQDELKIYDSKVDFKHFDFRLNSDSSMNSYNQNHIVTTTFNTKVIENKHIKVTLLPEYGGRILSVIYKPTGHELLYQNPVGTPYGIGENNFYYNWLMVYGGIFPSFPEPEHGKTWCLPWSFKIVEQNQDRISVEMSFTDNIPPVQGVTPEQFGKGKTDITCISTVTVHKDTSYVDYNIKLVNSRNEPVKYEYWTCTTLAPGSEPGNTVSPSNSEIIAPVEKVKLKDDWWPWMGLAEKPSGDGGHIFEYKNLALFSNWKDMGIAYASPSIEKEWWGAINHGNEEGILRIANNKENTPGLKFWTWGDKNHSTSITKFGDSSRPYIELWAGNSLEFFSKSELAPKEEKSWDEYYMPTVGLSKITYANQHAAVDMNYTSNEADNQFNFNANIFTTHPGKNLRVNLKLSGDKEYNLLSSKFTSDPAAANKITVPISKSLIDQGDYSYELIVKTDSNDILLRTGIPFTSKPTQKNTDSGDKQVQLIDAEAGKDAKAVNADEGRRTIAVVILIVIFAAGIGFVLFRRKIKLKR